MYSVGWGGRKEWREEEEEGKDEEEEEEDKKKISMHLNS